MRIAEAMGYGCTVAVLALAACGGSNGGHAADATAPEDAAADTSMADDPSIDIPAADVSPVDAPGPDGLPFDADVDAVDAKASGDLLADLMKLCLFGKTCSGGPLTTYNNVGTCVRGQLLLLQVPDGGGTIAGLPAEEVLACTRAAANCDDFLDCVTRSHGVDYCTAHPGGSCDGDLAVACKADGTRPWVRDCTVFDMPCRVDGGKARCSNGTPCPAMETSPSLTCAGNTVLRCDGSSPVADAYGQCPEDQPCTQDTMTDPEGHGTSTAYCRRPCSNNARHCEGEVVVSCAVEGDTAHSESRTDCQALGAHCKDFSGSPRCVYADTACDPNSDPAERCEGDFLVTCIQGRWTPVDCTIVGRTKCATESNYSKCT